MLRSFVALALAGTLLTPLAVTAQTPPTSPTTPAAPPAPAPPQGNRVRGKISAVDAAKKTLTVVSRRGGTVTLSVPDDAKIFKTSDTSDSPTGTFADLTVDTMITAQTEGDAQAPVAKTIHIRAPRNAAPATPPAAPAPPTTPPATPPAP